MLTGLSAFPPTPLRNDRLDLAAFDRVVRMLAASRVDSLYSAFAGTLPMPALRTGHRLPLPVRGLRDRVRARVRDALTEIGTAEAIGD